MSDPLLTSSADGVREMRLNRPEKRNAITYAMYEARYRGLTGAQADETVRVVLLTGEGAAFCAGNDLNDFLNGPEFSSEHPVMGFLHTLATFGKPLVAGVHGQAVGIGVTMLLHCDLIVASRTAQLSMPFVKLGLVPEAASSLLLPRLVGPQRAAELLLLGTPIDSAAALNFGLINRVVEDDVLLEEARTLARTVAEQPAGALRATKQLLRSETGVSARIEEEMLAFQERLDSAEFKSAVQAFFGKGRPG